MLPALRDRLRELCDIDAVSGDERPLLLVPPCINKFYIMDLQPANSLVRYAVEQGHTVFLVSWVNPDASLKDATWDDYIQNGAIKAIEIVREMIDVLAERMSTLGVPPNGLPGEGHRPTA